MRWVQFCGSLSILWHCLSLGLEWKLTFSSLWPVLSFLNLLPYWVQHLYSIMFQEVWPWCFLIPVRTCLNFRIIIFTMCNQKQTKNIATITKSVWEGFPNSNLHRGLFGYLSGQNKPGLGWHKFSRWLDTMVGIAN